MGPVISFLAYGLAAIICGLAALVVMRFGAKTRSDRIAAVAALLLSGIWCATSAALGPGRLPVALLEITRNLAWIIVLYRLFANDGRDESLRIVQPVVFALALVEGLQLILIGLTLSSAKDAPLVMEISTLFRVLVAVGALVLVHNLYGGAAATSRKLLAWNTAAMALFWLFELNLYTVGYLSGSTPSQLNAFRAIAMAIAAIMFAFGYVQRSSELAFRPSRAVTFSTLSIVLASFYFLGMIALSRGAASASGDLARVTQVGILLLAAGLALLWIPSPRLRKTLRVFTLKHLFKHRYDYRNEWIRFTHTMGAGGIDGATLPQRAIRALADITESTAGLLLTVEEEGGLTLSERWCWPTLEVPPMAMPPGLARILERETLILDLDEVRDGIDHHGEAALVPEWLIAEPHAWAAVPLLHDERLVGVVVLARPQVPRRLDWEDFDLLAISGQQVASYLAERASQKALEEAARFDEFNRRMAFVMHDIKNLSSQMGLLARNAERHAENPEFRKDMVKTLRNSTDKLDALVTRLGRYGTSRSENLQSVNLLRLAQQLRERFNPTHRIELAYRGVCKVLADEEGLEQAVAHLIQNAIDASPRNRPVTIDIRNDGIRGEISISDTGTGMSAQFVRNELFRPFQSTKEDGFGIGACEARELVGAMGGRLDVQSREGLGSRFSISLPLAEAARLLARRRPGEDNFDEEAA